MMHAIEMELEQRILILDGAMGTMIQTYGLTEKDYRDERLKDHPIDLKGNFEMLNLVRPEIIKEIHIQYLEAGADIICTNTFGANEISQNDYQTSDLVYELNYKAAKIAREAVLEIQKKNKEKNYFVAGAMGPTTKMASMSPDVNNPAFRAVNFDQLVSAYTEQANALIDGGIDVFLLETITDTLNAKAALFSLMQLFEERKITYPIMVSATITDASGRILSGQTVEAFLISISHAPVLSVGLNCALGANELRPYIQTLHAATSFYVSTHPNAGLPNQFGGYDQSAQELAALIAEFTQNGWLNIVGGCCGTTPEHIKAIAEVVKGKAPREKFGLKTQKQTLKKVTDNETRQLIENWLMRAGLENAPAFSLQELITILAKVKDEPYFSKLRAAFEKEKKLYHPEQTLLFNAHVFGKQQWLRTAV